MMIEAGNNYSDHFFQGSEKMNSKVFSQRFNRELELLRFPTDPRERVDAVAKVFGVKPYLANNIIFGEISLTKDQLYNIARILDVCPHFLSGLTEKRKAFPEKELLED